MNSKVYLVFLFFIYTNCVHGYRTTTLSESTTDPTDSATAFIQRSGDSKGDGVDNKEGLIIIGNPESNIVGYFNVSQEHCMIMDLERNLIAVANGPKQIEVVIDINNRNGVYVPGDPKVKAVPSAREYLSSLDKGLKPLLDQENAIEFSFDVVSQEILKAINEILNQLVDDISEELERNPKAGLELSLTIGKELLRLRELKGFVPILGIRGASVRGDLVRSTNIIKGLIALYGRVPGGLPALIEAGAKIRFQKIANSRNGLQTLTEVMREISVKNVGDILGDLLNNPQSLLKLIRLLGGNSSNGVNGVMKVVAAVSEYANGETSLEYMINIIIQFMALNSENDNNPEEILRELKQSISGVLEAIDDADCTSSLSGAVKVLSSLKEGNLIINKIKISSIISRLISTIDKPKELQIIVSILLDLKEVIDIKESLPRLLIVMILNINSPLGINMLERCGVSTDIDTCEISGGIIEHILKSVANITSRLRHNLYEGLCSVPALDKIIKSIDSAISECGGDKKLRDLLAANDVVEELIKAMLQVAGGLELDVPDDTCERISETMDKCSSVSFYASIDVNVTISG